MAILVDRELKQKLFEHLGHSVVIESYGTRGGPPAHPDEADEIALECEDCKETLISAKSEE